MAHKYTYPVVDLALRNFLMFVLVLMALVAVAMTLGASFELIDLPMETGLWEIVEDYEVNYTAGQKD